VPRKILDFYKSQFVAKRGTVCLAPRTDVVGDPVQHEYLRLLNPPARNLSRSQCGTSYLMEPGSAAPARLLATAKSETRNATDIFLFRKWGSFLRMRG
jgi:hypothetical protein